MELSQVAAGRPFTRAVRDAVDQLKSADPLHPVRVLVPSNLAGLSLRRMLGSRILDDQNTVVAAGIANVAFSTPFQFASLLAVPALAHQGKRPLTTPVLAAAVRHVLSTNPGRFGAVAEHVATESALIRMYGEITELPPIRRQQLSASSAERTRDLIGFIDAVDAHLGGESENSYHDEYDVLCAASEALADHESSAGSESLVLAGPFSQGLATIEFLAVVARRQRVRGVLSLTGDVAVDDVSRGQARDIFGVDAPKVEVDLPRPTNLLPTADPDEEVRAVTRAILSASERGVRFDRMAVFVPVRAPYLRTVREQLDSAGIPSAGPDHRTLADSMAGRLLGRVLSLTDASQSLSSEKRFEREAVLALVEAAPIFGRDGRRLQSGPWENISRSAGVVSGLDDWATRLSAHSASITKRIDDNRADAASGFLSSLEREQTAANELADFVAWLAELTAPEHLGSSWSERSEWARSVLARLLPPENRRGGWPENEVESAERVDKILSRVAVLDSIEPHLTSSAFLRAIQLELEVPAGRRGRFGTGVLVSPLASAVGLDLDEVFVVGLAEGVCPRPIREDTLLPDSERLLTEGALPVRADHNLAERHRFLHAVASGGQRSTLLLPRGDHRSGRERTASRWWVEAARALSGDSSLTSKSWPSAQLFEATALGSFEEALTSAVREGVATSMADLQLHAIHAAKRFGREPEPESVAGALRRGLEQTSTRLEGFNRFSGDLGSIDVPRVVADDAAISPSRLESWATCPRRFYFEQLLRLGEIDRPEAIAEISALDKGNLWHQILEDFIGASLPDTPGALTSPDQRWTDEDRVRLEAIAERRYKQYEDLGRTGRPILWEIKKEETNADLETFLRSDEELRSELRSVPVDVEMPFGLARDRSGQPEPAAEVTLEDGRTIRLRGLIDRLDMRSDGVPVVLDYKTGGASSPAEFERDPVVGGRRLQLGVYAEAAKQRLGTDDAYAYYWYTSSRGGFKHVGYPWTAERRERFTDAVETIVDGIERGDFPPNPGDYNAYYGSFENCSFCAFTRICPADRDEELEQAIGSNRLVDYVRLHEDPTESVMDGDEGEVQP